MLLCSIMSSLFSDEINFPPSGYAGQSKLYLLLDEVDQGTRGPKCVACSDPFVFFYFFLLRGSFIVPWLVPEFLCCFVGWFQLPSPSCCSSLSSGSSTCSKPKTTKACHFKHGSCRVPWPVLAWLMLSFMTQFLTHSYFIQRSFIVIKLSLFYETLIIFFFINIALHQYI